MVPSSHNTHSELVLYSIACSRASGTTLILLEGQAKAEAEAEAKAGAIIVTLEFPFHERGRLRRVSRGEAADQ